MEENIQTNLEGTDHGTPSRGQERIELCKLVQEKSGAVSHSRQSAPSGVTVTETGPGGEGCQREVAVAPDLRGTCPGSSGEHHI